MKSFEFTIAATGLPLDTDEWEYAFYEAGCDDATVSLQRGVFILFFDREAEDFESAARSACSKSTEIVQPTLAIAVSVPQ